MTDRAAETPEEETAGHLPGRIFRTVGHVAGKLLSSAGHVAGTTGRRAALVFAGTGESVPDYGLEELARSLAGWFEIKSSGEAELAAEKPGTLELDQLDSKSKTWELLYCEPGFLGKTFRFIFCDQAHPKVLKRAGEKTKGIYQTALICKRWPLRQFSHPRKVTIFVWREGAQFGARQKIGDYVSMWLVDFLGFRFRSLDFIEKPREKDVGGIFVGREQAVEVFEEALGRQEGPFVISITAHGGTGKSYFLKRLHEVYGPGILFSKVDHQHLEFDDDSRSGLMNLFKTLARGLREEGCPTPNFDRALAQSLRHKESGEPRGFGGAIRRTVQAVGGVNPLVAAVGAGLDLVANWSQELKEESEALAQDVLIQTLTSELIKDLKKFVEEQREQYFYWRRPVLVFDTYELLAVVVDTWLRLDLVTDVDFQNLAPMVLIGGRHALLQVNTRWSELQEHVRHLALKPFDEAGAREYLDRLKVDPERHDELIELASGSPLFLNLAAHCQSHGAAVKALTARVLEETQPDDRPLFLAAAVPEQGFNRDVLSKLAGESLDEATFERIARATFMETEAGRWQITPSVRKVFLLTLELESPQRLAELRALAGG